MVKHVGKLVLIAGVLGLAGWGDSATARAANTLDPNADRRCSAAKTDSGRLRVSARIPSAGSFGYRLPDWPALPKPSVEKRDDF